LARSCYAVCIAADLESYDTAGLVLFPFVDSSHASSPRRRIRQRRQENMELFQTRHRMRAAGLKATEMAKKRGVNRRRLDRWLRFDGLPGRNRMQPRPGDAGSLSRVLATAVGSELPARSNSFCGSAGTWLCRLLLQTGGTPLPAASTIGGGSNAIAGNSI
jgi:hypothetical protein